MGIGIIQDIHISAAVYQWIPRQTKFLAPLPPAVNAHDSIGADTREIFGFDFYPAVRRLDNYPITVFDSPLSGGFGMDMNRRIRMNLPQVRDITQPAVLINVGGMSIKENSVDTSPLAPECR